MTAGPEHEPKPEPEPSQDPGQDPDLSEGGAGAGRLRRPATRVWIRVAAVVAGILAVVAIAGWREQIPPRGEVLAELAAEVIVPAMERLSIEAAGLADATAKLCENPTPAALAEARDVLVSTRETWSYSEAMWVGPIMDRRSWAVIDWPISEDEIEELIADETLELDHERLSNRIGSDQRGLGAVEYILGGPADDAAVLESLSDPRRCAYLVGIAAVIDSEAALLPLDWTVDAEGLGPYREVFADEMSSGLDSIVNDALFLLEAMADLELGIALGAITRDAPLDVIAEGPLGLGVSDLEHHLLGLRDVLVGRESDDGGAAGAGGVGGDGADGSGEAGFAGLRPLLGDGISNRLASQIDYAGEALAAVDPPLRSTVVDDPETVTAAREAIKTVQITVGTEVVSRLGVTIGFNDADGDTGL